MFNSPLISVIVLNLNGQRYLARCLPSLFIQDYPTFEVIVVDNGSTAEDGSVEWLKAHYPQARLIENGRNLGFCLGNNIGVRQSRGEYVILLNNDTELEPGFLTAMVTTAASRADVGMVASQILLDHDPTLLDSAGIEVDGVGMSWNRHLGLPAKDEPLEPQEVFGPSAAAGLYKRAMLDQVGLLDEDYFIYYEDVDLAWRGQRAGWRCLYAPAAKVRHIHSGTTGRWSTFKTYLLGRNKVWTMLKNYPTASLWRNLPLIIIYEKAAILYSLIFLHKTAALRGRLAALKEIPKFLAKRRQFNSTIPTYPVQLAPIKPPRLAWQIHRTIKHE